MLLLADSTPQPDAQFFMQFVLCIGLIVSICTNLIMIFRANRSQKREVSFTTEFPTRTDCDKEHVRVWGKFREQDVKIEEMRKEFNASIRQYNEAGEARATKIHERINLILDGVGELRGKMSTK